jgi:hypothetical protein
LPIRTDGGATGCLSVSGGRADICCPAANGAFDPTSDIDGHIAFFRQGIAFSCSDAVTGLKNGAEGMSCHTLGHPQALKA